MEGAKTYVSLKPISEVFTYHIPQAQRSINKDHVKGIVKDQIDEYQRNQCFSILQAISVTKIANDSNQTYIIDGQHRYHAFKELEQLGYDVKAVLVPVVTYNVMDDVGMLRYFNMINKNMPIHPLELQQDYTDFGKVLIENMTKTFPIYLKHDSKNSRCPHINMNDFKKNLAGRSKLANQLKDHDINVHQLWDKILEFNEYVKANLKATQQLCPMMSKRITDCETKATKAKTTTICYLGIWRKFEWLDFTLTSLLDNNLFSDINLACDTNPHISIPITVREQVWKKCNTNTSDLGLCYTCCNDLYFRDMECGHIKAHALGGNTTLENLMPVCKSCNKDMGVMNLFEYKEMIEKMSH